jgi:hypothetical protein
MINKIKIFLYRIQCFICVFKLYRKYNGNKQVAKKIFHRWVRMRLSREIKEIKELMK